jgi:CRISPR-associated endonuclease Cas2
MGKIEGVARKRRKRNNIQKAVLSTIGAVGVISVALLAPNVFQALPHVMGRQQYKLRFQAKNALQRLIIKGFVKRNGRGQLEITGSGRRHLAIEEASAASIARTKRKWDGQFRLVMFDIPQTRRRTRDRLRELMRAFGFLRLQDSVWVTPYDCEDLLALVKAELRVGKDILYAVVNEIENNRAIKSHFGLL